MSTPGLSADVTVSSNTQMQSVLLEVQSAVLADHTLRDEQRAQACSAIALADKVGHTAMGTIGVRWLHVLCCAAWHPQLSDKLLQALCDGADEFLQLLNLGSGLQQAMHA